LLKDALALIAEAQRAETKAEVEARNRVNGLLEQFIDENCYHVDGECVLFSEFYEKFLATLEPSDRYEWSHKKRVVQALPRRFPYGNFKNNSRYIGNLSFTQVEPTKPRLAAEGGQLIHSGALPKLPPSEKEAQRTQREADAKAKRRAKWEAKQK